MFGKEKLRALEIQLNAAKERVQAAQKENEELVKAKESLQKQLSDALERAGQLESRVSSMENQVEDLKKQLEESELSGLKKQAQQTIVEYEGMKDLYNRKARELDETRADIEEGFAREAATKRHDLAEEIRQNRDENRAMVGKTTATFAGSYLYYLDQIRTMMDALNQAAQETGATLYDGDVENIRERFGARILDHLRTDSGALSRNEGDRLLIDAEAAVDNPAADEDAPEAPDAPEVPEDPEAPEDPEDPEAPDSAEELCEAAGDAVPEAREAAGEIPEAAAEILKESISEEENA